MCLKKISYIDVFTNYNSILTDYEHKISKLVKYITKKKLNIPVYIFLKLKIFICGEKGEIH
jgi:hypothetical protein